MRYTPPSCSMGDTGAGQGHRRSLYHPTTIGAPPRQHIPPPHRRRASMGCPCRLHLAQRIIHDMLVLPPPSSLHLDHRRAPTGHATTASVAVVTARFTQFTHATPAPCGLSQSLGQAMGRNANPALCGCFFGFLFSCKFPKIRQLSKLHRKYHKTHKI
jgi:hypothetical protein